MRQLAEVLLLVCAFLLLSVLLVESVEEQFVPSFCRQFIDQTQAANFTDAIDDKDEDEDETDEDVDDDVMNMAVEEINMLNMIIDYMAYVHIGLYNQI